MDQEIVKLGSAKLNAGTGAPQWQAINEISDDPGDSEDFGEIDVFQCLGVTSIPWPADDTGFAEGVAIRNCGNRNGVVVGARDLRTAKALGNAKPGDTILHSTGPQQAAQLQLKEAKRQVVAFTKDSAGKGMVVTLDGTNDKIQVSGFKMLIEMVRGEGIKIDNGEGACIVLQGGDIFFMGNLHLPGLAPGQAIAAGSPVGDPSGVSPTFAVLGVSN